MDEVVTPAGPEANGAPDETFTTAEAEKLVALNRALARAYGGGDASGDRREAQELYLDLKARVMRRAGRFGIVNNRIFFGDDRLTVPYLVGDTLVVQRVENGETRTVTTWRFPVGTLITDKRLRDLAGCGGEVIDLEKAVFDLDVEQAVEIRVSRLRDMSALLARVNEITNRNEAVYALRFLVAQLCSPSFKGFLGTKNLQPEVRNLVHELKRFVNTRIARRVPLLVRIIVRNVSGIVVRPGLIDSLWNDAIELSESAVRGSDIANEIRRSTHHALGERTLRLTRAYREYLETGETEPLERQGYPRPSPADAEAREDPAARALVARMVTDLDRLLGTTEVLTQLRDWQAEFGAAVFGCDTGRSLEEEAEAVVRQGVEPRNRWVYYLHLRALRKKAGEFTDGADPVAEFTRRVEALLALRPDEDGFDARAAEDAVRAAVEEFTAHLREAHVAPVFGELEMALNAYSRRAFYETAGIIHRLRREVAARIERGGFFALRYHLYQLDCLLEKMSYLALRHISSQYEDKGVRLKQCLQIIQGAILNLAHDGLYSREVADLAGMLTDGNKTYGELANVMEALQRNYHKALQRITAPYEKMQARLHLNDVELRIALANMQRYMHDHNIMVNFCDLARTFIRRHIAHSALRVSRASLPPPDPEEAFDFLHLSDRRRIRALVEGRARSSNLRERYGGKGSGLIYLSHLGIPSRDGFVLPTVLPRAGLHHTAADRLATELVRRTKRLEADIAARDGSHRTFADPARPLLLAVRGGSVFSMPGILSTVVFLGMNDAIAASLAQDDPWYAYDSYRRFLASFSSAMWGIDLERYDLVPRTKERYGVQYKNDLPWVAMKEISDASLEILRDAGHAAELERYLADPWQQLFAAVRVVLDSWNRPRAQRFREIKGLCHTWQTACTVQQMACGNRRDFQVGPRMDETRASLTGVIPRTRMTPWGVRTFTGEMKFSAAGDDLVGGVTSSKSFLTIGELKTLLPMLHRRLKHIVAKIMNFMGADQEVEFTVERGVLSVLQVRAAETGADQEGPPFLDPGEPVTHGIGIRGGGFRGRVAFDDADLKALAARPADPGEEVDGVLMVIENPTPDDIPLILSADGLLTAKGGNTSHAAVAINGLERSYSAVMSAVGLKVLAGRGEAEIRDAEGRVRHRLRRGDIVSIHGTDGDVFLGSRPLYRGTGR
jgi:phosphoenolpyruvate synthase/pyruvate phosphate dikinase